MTTCEELGIAVMTLFGAVAAVAVGLRVYRAFYDVSAPGPDDDEEHEA